MTETIKARYRNKLAKVIIEVWNGEKWLYVKTLRDPLTEFSAECLEKVSHSSPVLEEKTPQKFGQSLLNEQPKQDIKEALKLVDDVISPRKEGMPDE